MYAGTTVTRGRGLVLVRRTGSSSALGGIAALVAGTRSRPTPLQRRLSVLGAQLSVAVVVLSAVVLVVGLARGRGLTEMTLTAVSLAVAAVPESLPAMVTLALALGARRMAQRSALVRGLPAVETLGSVSTLATDKTGTLTENAMVVQRVLTPTGEYVVTGTGYGPEGEILPVAPGADPHDDEDLRRLVRDVVLCNDANVLPPDREHQDWRPVGDPTEAALVTFSAKAQRDVQQLRVDHPRIEEVPFDGTRGWMATAHSTPAGTLVVYKGGADILLPSISRGDLAQTGAMVRAARWAEDCARDGLRVLAVAQVCHSDGRRAVTHLDDAEGAVPSAVPHLVGLVAMADPPRADLRSLVGTLQGAGIRLVLITGDHPATASAVAREVGLADHDSVPVTGNDLRSGISPAAITRSVVFARIRPEQKLDIVRALQAAGQVVAMTGDGVNDAPALRAADIGVAMGRGGTEVARQAADLVLTDDHLTTVAAAVEEGRRIHDNVRRFLRYALSGGLAEIAFMLAAPFAGFAVPLLPAQILWINMLTHGLPGVAFGADPADPAAMTRSPKPPDEAILGAGLVGQIAATGALIVAATFGASVWARASGFAVADHRFPGAGDRPARRGARHPAASWRGRRAQLVPRRDGGPGAWSSNWPPSIGLRSKTCWGPSRCGWTNCRCRCSLLPHRDLCCAPPAMREQEVAHVGYLKDLQPCRHGRGGQNSSQRMQRVGGRDGHRWHHSCHPSAARRRAGEQDLPVGRRLGPGAGGPGPLCRGR